MAANTTGRGSRKLRRCQACGVTEAQEPNLVPLHDEWLCPNCVQVFKQASQPTQRALSQTTRPFSARSAPAGQVLTQSPQLTHRWMVSGL